METSLYEHFNCKNKEELYELYKNNDEKVRELIDYIKSEENFFEDRFCIKDKNKVKEFIKDGIIKIPENNEISLITLDSKNAILNNNVYNKNQAIEEIIKKSYSSNMVSYFLIVGNKSENKANLLENSLKIIGYKNIDRWNSCVMSEIRDDIKKFYSRLAEDTIILDDIPIKEKNKLKAVNKTPFYKEDSLSKYKEYKDFMNYFAQKDLLGKNLFLDRKEIKKILQKSYQHFDQEYVHIIQHDKNLNIVNCENLFKGGIANTSVDPRLILPKILEENVLGISLVHNHPSGNSKESEADRKITDVINKTCKILKKDLLEHFIATKEKVTSFTEEKLLEPDYKNIIEKVDDIKVLEIMKKELPNYSDNIGDRQDELRSETLLEVAESKKNKICEISEETFNNLSENSQKIYTFLKENPNDYKSIDEIANKLEINGREFLIAQRELLSKEIVFSNYDFTKNTFTLTVSKNVNEKLFKEQKKNRDYIVSENTMNNKKNRDFER
jgi:hypothetical protein